MNKSTFITDINEINANIAYAEQLLKEAMSFCEEDDIETSEMEDDTTEEIPVEEPVVGNNIETEDEITPETSEAVESYVDHIRKYSLNALSALADTPESEEYQMLKKIFQMCDKKPEKKDNITESHRIFGIHKLSKEVLFESNIDNPKDFKNFQKTLTEQAKKMGINPADIRLVSENKIIC